VSEPGVAGRAREAEQLRNAWQQKFGEARGLLGDLAKRHEVTYGAVHQLYSGTRPLSAIWKHRFADYLGVPPEQIWPDIHRHLPQYVFALLTAALAAPEDRVRAATLLLSPDVPDEDALAERVAQLSEDDRRIVSDLMRTLARR
jgi:hypothetical protein